MEHQLLQDLHAERDDWLIKVRIVRLWNVYTTKNEEEPIFLEMILLDEKGTPLHAAIRKDLMQDFKDIIQEGNLYTIKNLRIEPSNESYKPVEGSLKAWFLPKTTISEIKDSKLLIPPHYFEFASLDTIAKRVGEKVMLSDIIGILLALGNEEVVYVLGKPTKIRRLELKLQENEVVKVTLWRNIATEFSNMLLNQKEGKRTKIVAITSTLVKKFRDEYSINSTSSTKMYVNLDGHQIPHLSESNVADEMEIREIPIHEFANTTPEKRMARNRSTLQNIMSMQWESVTQEKVYTILATIDDIDDTYGWHYIGCEICMKKLTKEGNQYHCPTCKQASKYPTPRFKVQLKVSDEMTSTIFTLFDTEAQKLLNITASQLLQQGSTTNIPSILQNLCHRSLIFEIRLSDRNLKEGWQNYAVTKTFVPNNILHDQILHTPIKEEPVSPKTKTTGTEDQVLIKPNKHEPVSPQTISSGGEENEKQESKLATPKKKGQTYRCRVQKPSSNEEKTLNCSTSKKQPAKSQVTLSSDDENEKQECKVGTPKKKRQPYRLRVQITSSDEDTTLNCSRNKKQSANSQDTLSSDDEPILIQTLRTKKNKKGKK